MKDGTIYLLGGDYLSATQQWVTSRFCYKIDPNLHVSKIQSLKKPRSLMACKPVRDRFIFRIGGREDSHAMQYITDCDCYDTQKNQWYKIQNLPSASAGCHYISIAICDDDTVLALPSEDGTVFQAYMLDLKAVF